jgi:hypothetical protein
MEDCTKLTRQEYEDGVKSGKFLHVFNIETKKISVIQRDGYYPPKTREKLINIEH